MEDALADVMHRPGGADDWRHYVHNKAAEYKVTGIHPGFDRSWLLRKGVRAGLELTQISELVTGELRADPTGNDAEALRYALLDGRENVFRVLVAMLPPEYDRSRLILWAALANNWSAVDALERSQSHNDAYVAEVRAVLANGAPVPTPPVVDWAAEWQLLATSDDRDNYQALDGLVVTDAATRTSGDAQTMSEWLPAQKPGGDHFVDRLGELLARAYSNFRVLGSGTFGMVLAATNVNDGRQVALKFVTVADPLGKLPARRRQLARAELRINLALARWDRRDSFPALPTLTQWTRGRFNMHKALATLRASDSSSSSCSDGPILAGTAIYLVMEMPVLDFTLLEWMRAAVRVANGDREQLRKYARITEAFIVTLVAQLHEMRRVLPDFRHTDIKGNNVLLKRVRAQETVARASAQDGRVVVVVRGGDSGGYAASLSDFGLSSYKSPRGPIGAVSRVDDDLQFIIKLPPKALTSDLIGRWQADAAKFAGDPGAALVLARSYHL